MHGGRRDGVPSNQKLDAAPPFVFGVDTIMLLWSTSEYSAWRLYRGVLETDEQFMARMHEDDEDISRQRKASAVSGSRLNGEMGENRSSGRKPDQGNTGRRSERWSSREAALLNEAVDERGKETMGSVAWYQAD